METKDCVKVLIGADVLPTPRNELLFAKGDAIGLVGAELYEKICQADFRIYNLEGPLTDEMHPILKDGPVLSAPSNTVAGLKALKADLLLLANNHILDHGQKGAEETLEVLEHAEIDFIGIGRNASHRARSYCIEMNETSICIYNCCEHEFSILPEGELGSNAYDPLVSFDEVRRLKKEHDYVVVLYHGGKECFRYPSPELMRVFRKFAEEGADVVIAQHTHCIGSYEMYNDSLLLYGQGNFIFDRADNEFYNSGLLVQLVFTKSEGFACSYIPMIRTQNTVKFATGEQGDLLLAEFENRSVKIKDPEFILQEYAKNAQTYLNQYLPILHGISRADILLKKLFRNKFVELLLRKAYPPQLVASIYNYISCEAHLELLRAGLKQLIDPKDN